MPSTFDRLQYTLQLLVPRRSRLIHIQFVPWYWPTVTAFYMASDVAVTLWCCLCPLMYSVYIRGQCVSGERWGFPGVYSALALNCISHISCQVSRQFRRSADHTGGLHLLTIWLYTSQSAIHHGYGHLWAPVACWWCSSALILLTSTMWLRDRSSGCLNTQPSLFSLSLRPASVLSSGCDAGVF